MKRNWDQLRGETRQIRDEGGTLGIGSEQSHHVDVLCKFCKSSIACGLARSLSKLQGRSDINIPNPKWTVQDILSISVSSCWLCIRMKPILQRMSEDQYDEKDQIKVEIEFDVKRCLSSKRMVEVRLVSPSSQGPASVCVNDPPIRPDWRAHRNHLQPVSYKLSLGPYENISHPTISFVAKTTDYVDACSSDEMGSVGRMSAARLKTIKTWLVGCLGGHSEEHSNCAHSIKDQRFLPRRLIQISSSSGQIHAAVVEQKEIRSKTPAPYATLSHCWGQARFMTLKKANYDTFHSEIDLSSLGRTFREAIQLCHDLGLAYLWIDSLCIIQDSDEAKDWIEQAPVMHKIYEASILNIVAAASSACCDGLFRELQSVWFRHIEINLPSSDPNEEVLVLCDRAHHTFRHWGELPVFHRGWCVQELFLAPRNIYFSDMQLYWSCLTKHKGEIISYRLQKMLRYIYRYDVAQGVRQSGSSLDREWKKLVIDYATTKVTVKIDRLYALAGIAAWFDERYSEVGSKTEYLVGLWSHMFPSNLLWRNDTSIPTKDFNPEGFALDPSINPVIPSWSWLSFNGIIPFEQGSLSESIPYMSFQHSEIELLLPELPFGPVKSARVMVRATMFTFRIMRLPQPLLAEENAQVNSPSMYGRIFRFAIPADCVAIQFANGSEVAIPQDHRTKESPIHRLIVKVYYDHDSSTKAPFPRNVVFMPVVLQTFPEVATLHGLVVESSAGGNPGWRRLGTMTVSSGSHRFVSANEDFGDRHWVDDLEGYRSNRSREFLKFLMENNEYHDFYLV